MSKGTAPITEDLSEVTGLEALNFRGRTPLGPEWGAALARRVQQFHILAGRDVIVFAHEPRPFLIPYWLVEETSTNVTGLVAESELSAIVSTASGLVMFPQAQPSGGLVEIPTEIGKRQEPVIRGKGVPVWVLVAYATKRHMSPEQISRLWNGYVTQQEVGAALAYWRTHPEAVEDKLSDTE